MRYAIVAAGRMASMTAGLPLSRARPGRVLPGDQVLFARVAAEEDAVVAAATALAAELGVRLDVPGLWEGCSGTCRGALRGVRWSL